MTIDVRGNDQVSGLPKAVPVGTWEITEATAEAVNAILGAVRAVLEQTPPELATDVVDKGMILTGGGALLRNLDKLLTRETGIPAYLAEDPPSCVAIGMDGDRRGRVVAGGRYGWNFIVGKHARSEYRSVFAIRKSRGKLNQAQQQCKA